MSFSGEVKEELQKQVAAARHCQIAELASILHFCGSLQAAEKVNNREEGVRPSSYGEKLVIQAENEAVIRKCFTLLKKTFNINTSVNEKRVGNSMKPGLKPRVRTSARIRAYDIELTDPVQIKQVLQAAKFMDKEGMLRDMRAPVSAMLIKNSCCQRAFLRGAFLSSGRADSDNFTFLRSGSQNCAEEKVPCCLYEGWYGDIRFPEYCGGPQIPDELRKLQNRKRNA